MGLRLLLGQVGGPGVGCITCPAYCRESSPAVKQEAAVHPTLEPQPRAAHRPFASFPAVAAMQWSDGDQWLLSLDLPAGSHEFKVVAVAPPAKEGACSYADWEAGPNRTLKVRCGRLCCQCSCLAGCTASPGLRREARRRPVEFAGHICHGAAGLFVLPQCPILPLPACLSRPTLSPQVPVAEAATHAAFTVVCEWGHTSSSLETLPSEELEAEEPLTGEKGGGHAGWGWEGGLLALRGGKHRGQVAQARSV